MNFCASVSPAPATLFPAAAAPSPSAASALASLSDSEGAAIRALLSASFAAHQQQREGDTSRRDAQWEAARNNPPAAHYPYGAPASPVQSPSPTPPPRPINVLPGYYSPGGEWGDDQDPTDYAWRPSNAPLRAKPNPAGAGALSMLGKRPLHDPAGRYGVARPVAASLHPDYMGYNERDYMGYNERASTMGTLPALAASSGGGSSKKPSKVGSKRARYDDDFKEHVVREAMRCPEGARIKPTCSRYPGVEPCQLRKWIQKFAPTARI